MAVFGDDLGFFAGQALAEQANTEQKVILAEALGQERAKNNALLFAQRNQMATKIQEIRRDNLKALAEFEYEIHTRMNVSYRMRVASEKLKDMSEAHGDTDKRELKLLSEKLMETREVHRRSDKDSWILNRWKQLMEQCAFPRNDQEAVMVGGYGMPFPGSVPPFAQADLDEISAGKNVDDVYRVMTDPEEIPAIQARLQRGPMKLG